MLPSELCSNATSATILKPCLPMSFVVLPACVFACLPACLPGDIRLWLQLGLANQTTMYKRETKEIGRMFEVAMLKKYGPSKLAEHYGEFDTICDATQERQDAVTDLVEAKDADLDFVLVVGGFDSSNTAHLKEIPEKYGERCYFPLQWEYGLYSRCLFLVAS